VPPEVIEILKMWAVAGTVGLVILLVAVLDR
jgi:hypothetical protein